jgi:DNA-binding transcriptional regulator YiaG
MRAKQKEAWPMPRPANCECGGSLRVATLDEYDFSDYVGFKVILTNVPGLRCDKCHGETIVGGMINAAMNLTLRRISESPRRLHGAEAKYLRRNLGITQEELAIRMGINRVTVAKWECGDEPISPQHDYILRGMILTGLALLNSIPREVVEKTLRSVFGAVRTLPPMNAVVIDASDLAMVPGSSSSKTGRRASM